VAGRAAPAPMPITAPGSALYQGVVDVLGNILSS